MIPKIIHYCWFGHNKLPNDTKRYIKTWKKYCPDYEIRKWDESNFDIDSCEFVRQAYEAKAWAFVSDYVRLKILYDNGGIYLDTDVELLRNLDFLLDTPFFACISQVQGLCNTGLGMGSIEGSPILKRMMDIYENIEFEPNKKEELACPYINDKIIKEFGYKKSDNVVKTKDMTILPPRYMDPYSPGDSRDLLCDDTISVHHYSASWTSNGNRLKRKILNKIGLDKIGVIKGLLK